MKVKFLSVAILAVALAIFGCAVGPDYAQPKAALPSAYLEASTAPSTEPVDLAVWWTTFHDPELSSLMDRAAKNNLSILSALSRIEQSRAQYAIAAAGRYPTLNADGSITHQRISRNSLTIPGGGGGPAVSIPLEHNIFQAGVDASWELDLWGHVRRAVEAADADLQAAVEDQRAVTISLLGQVGQSYIQLRGFQRQLAILQQNLQTQQQTLDLTHSLLTAGLASNLDASQAEAQVATTAAAIPQLQSQIRAGIHGLATLLGQQPQALADELSAPGAIPVGPASPPPGLPSELLRRRPDIRRAERQLAGASARIGLATAQLYPRFMLTGNAGQQSYTIDHWQDWASRYYSFGPTLSWPLFNAGSVRANVGVQNELQKQALLTYQNAILTALQEVEDALANYQFEQTRQQSLGAAVAADRRALDLATDLYKRGLSDFLTVLDAQRQLLLAQDSLAQSQSASASDLVTLYKALGGGWEVEKPSGK